MEGWKENLSWLLTSDLNTLMHIYECLRLNNFELAMCI